jgi:dipeptidase E
VRQDLRIFPRGCFASGLLACLLVCAAPGRAAPVSHTSPKASVMAVGGSMMNGEHFADSVLAGMREHYAGCRRIALVLHATPPAERDRVERVLRVAFAHLGFPTVESLHPHDEAGQRALLQRADGIFLGGGETFVMLAELHRTGQLVLLRERVLAGVPLCGSSAGANVTGLIVGTTNDFPVVDLPSREGLGFLPVTVNPHHPRPEEKAEFEARAVKIRGYLKFNPQHRVLALANAAMVRLHGGQARLVAGRAWLYVAGARRELAVNEVVPELSL